MEIYLGVTTETLKQAKSTSNSSSVIQQKKLLSPSKLEIHNESTSHHGRLPSTHDTQPPKGESSVDSNQVTVFPLPHVSIEQ